MKKSFLYLFFLILAAGCSVQLKDKKEEPQPLPPPPPPAPAQTKEFKNDLVIRGRYELKTIERWDAERVILEEGAEIITYGYELSIKADYFLAERATLRNFPEDLETVKEKHGRHGGNISVVAKFAEGHLEVLLKGEDGGPGKNGTQGPPGSRHPGCAGSNGANGGNAGSLSINIENGINLKLNYENKGGLPGKAGRRGAESFFAPAEEVISPPCDALAKEALDGLPGKPGQVCYRLTHEQNFTCL